MCEWVRGSIVCNIRTHANHMPTTPLPHVNASYNNTCYHYKVNNVCTGLLKLWVNKQRTTD